MNQKREYRILGKKKVALYRFAEERKREKEGGRKEYTTAVQEQVSRHEVKHRNGTKKENWVQCVMQRGITHVHDDFDCFVPPFFFHFLFSSDRLKGNNVGRKKHA